MAEATPKMLRFRTTLDGKEPCREPLADVWMRTVLSTRPSPSTTFRPPSLPRSPSTARRGGEEGARRLGRRLPAGLGRMRALPPGAGHQLLGGGLFPGPDC